MPSMVHQFLTVSYTQMTRLNYAGRILHSGLQSRAGNQKWKHSSLGTLTRVLILRPRSDIFSSRVASVKRPFFHLLSTACKSTNLLMCSRDTATVNACYVPSSPFMRHKPSPNPACLVTPNQVVSSFPPYIHLSGPVSIMKLQDRSLTMTCSRREMLIHLVSNATMHHTSCA